MQDFQGNVLTRDDTFFGVCQALGEDFGFNPNWLRIAFAVPLLYAPLAVLGAYAAAAAVVLVSRLIAPNPRLRAAPQDGAGTEAAPANAETGEREALPLAA